MPSALQQLYASEDSELPRVMVEALNELREGDEKVQAMADAVAEERCALFAEMKVATNDTGYPEKIQAIAEKNKILVELTNMQQKKAEAAYQKLSTIVFNLDKKRAYIYDKMPEHVALLKKQKLEEAKAATTAQEKKAIAAAPRDIISTETVHSNEPIYCICKKVSFGRMIGCDNENCPTEWFHFPCVGLDDSLPDPEEWYCANCRPTLRTA